MTDREITALADAILRHFSWLAYMAQLREEKRRRRQAKKHIEAAA